MTLFRKQNMAFLVLGALLLPNGPAAAAEGWGIEHEKISRMNAKVVDIVCELTGDCPANCGAGKRQLGLLTDKGRLIPVVKGQDVFANAVPDLVRHCGKVVTADGLLIENPKMTLFMLQFSKLAKNGKWRRANAFGKQWTEKHRKPANQWFKHDPQIRQTIADNGKLGVPGLIYKEEE